MIEQLLRWADKRGYRVAWGPAEVAVEATAEVEGRFEGGELEEQFFAVELAPVVAAGRTLAEGTAVVVAVPRPAHRVHFELEDGPIAAVLPPTYVGYRSLFEEVRQDLESHGLPGARVEHLMAPLKATAARLGLVRYGLNNVSYVPGAGSYVQLCAYVTDAELPVDRRPVGFAPELLEECAGCGACVSVCPTGAISDDRVLLSAHRCLTYLNEEPGEWPDGMPEWAHTCLLGCLECQQACPVNPQLEVEETGVRFSAAETRVLLAGGADGSRNAESGIRSKLAWLGQPYAEPVLGRNLRALAAAAGRTVETVAAEG